MARQRVFGIEWDRDAVLGSATAPSGIDEAGGPAHRPAPQDRPASSATFLVTASPVAENDFDRTASGIATGNVITGANTMSGSAGKDHGGIGALAIASATGTVNLTYGDITIDTKGNYTYTRTVAMDALPDNAVETLNYILVDSTAQTSNTATLTLLLNPASLTTGKVSHPDALINGSAYDEVITFNTPSSSGIGSLNGLGGDDVLKNTQNGMSVTLDGGAGNDTLISTASSTLMIGGAGADKIQGGALDYASYATSAKAVSVNLATGLGTLGDAQGDVLVGVGGIIGGKGNDILIGDGNGNELRGGGGNDELHGGGSFDTLRGEVGNDTLYGDDAADTLYGGLGNDNLVGGNGNDSLSGDAGADHLDGGADTDIATYFYAYSASKTGIVVDMGNPSKSTGEAKGDTFTSIEVVSGWQFNDTLIAGADAATLKGSLGDDKLIGGGGADTLMGEDGNDTLIGNGGDTLLGGIGNDTLISGAAADSLDGAADFDYASYATAKAAVAVDIDFGGLAGDALGDSYVNIEALIGSAFDDTFFGNKNADTFFGGAGNDTLFGQSNNDTLVGGAGADALDGAADIDTASYIDSKAVTVDLGDTAKSTGDAKGDSYVDIEIIEGSSFADKLIGDANANGLNGGLGTDKISGGGGGDTLNGEGGNDTVSGEADNDTVHGGIGDDKLDGGGGLDSLFGDDGNDVIFGGDDVDNLHGGVGNDKLDGGVGSDSLLGELGNDTLAGGDGDDSLVGAGGNDKLAGGAGSDTLDGGTGSDTLTGGAGADTFVFQLGGTGTVDKVTDFNAAEDFIKLGSSGDIQDLIDAGFTAFSTGSTLTISQSHIPNLATDMVINGWTGGQVAGDIQTVALVLGSHLIY